MGTNRKQRYRCRNCGYNYTLPVVSTADFKNWGYPPEVREAVLALHRNDRSLGYRRIATQVGGGLTHGTVRNWIVAEQIKARKDQNEARTIQGGRCGLTC